MKIRVTYKVDKEIHTADYECEAGPDEDEKGHLMLYRKSDDNNPIAVYREWIRWEVVS